MKFYNLDSEDKYYAEPAEGTDWESITCSVHEDHRRAGKRIGDLRVDLPSSKVPHFIATILGDWIITDEVAKLFEGAGFTGYELKPVTVDKVRRGNKQEVPQLWELIITGLGGDAHPKSGINLKYECSACGYSKYSGFTKGLYIDATQWDGSDFFYVWPLPKFVIVAERVKKYIESHKLKNCKFIPTEDLVSVDEEGELNPGMRVP